MNTNRRKPDDSKCPDETIDDEYHTINELEPTDQGKSKGMYEDKNIKPLADCDYAKPLKQNKKSATEKVDVMGGSIPDSSDTNDLMVENDEYESSGNVMESMTSGGKDLQKDGDSSMASVGDTKGTDESTEQCEYDTPLSTAPPDLTDENDDYETSGSVDNKDNTNSTQPAEYSNNSSKMKASQNSGTEYVDILAKNDGNQTSVEMNGDKNGPGQEDPEYFVLEDSNAAPENKVTMVENTYYSSSDVSGTPEQVIEENPYM